MSLNDKIQAMDASTDKLMSQNQQNDNIMTDLFYQNEARKRSLMFRENGKDDEKEKLTERKLLDEFVNVAPILDKTHLTTYLKARMGDGYTASKLRSVWELVRADRDYYKVPQSQASKINLWRGLYDVKTKTYAKREYGSISAFGAQKRFISHYDVNATAPNFKRVLSELNTDKNPTLGQDLLKMYAYCAFGGNKLKTMFVLYGDGDDGKSLIQNAIRRALGSYVGVVSPKKVRYSQGKDDQFQTWLSNMDGKKFAMVSEWGEADRLDNALIKQIVSGGGGVAELEQKNQNEQMQIQLDFTMVIDTNFIPDVTNVEPALLKRLAVLKFNRQYADDEKDLTLDGKLEAEKSGILNMLIEAYDPDWRVPDKYRNQILEEQAEQQLETDDMLAFILKQHGYTVTNGELDTKLNSTPILTAELHSAVRDDLKRNRLNVKIMKDYLVRHGVTINNHGSQTYRGLQKIPSIYRD